jgi:hypothetical protein
MSDPLKRGLSAGQSAYHGTPPQRMGISAADLSAVRGDVSSGLQSAAAQRQMVDTNAAKQAAGAYPTSGTSAAMYNYMRGQGGYPVNAVPSGQPVNTGSTGYGGISTLPARTVVPTTSTIQKPYEQTVKTGTPTQTELATKAVTLPTKMGKVTAPTVNIPKPTMAQQLMATAAPLALGYYALDKTGGLGYLGKGWDKLFGSEALPTGYDASSTQALIDQYYTNPSIDLASAGSEDALQILADREAARIAAENAAAASAEAAGQYGGPATAGISELEGGAGSLTAGTNLDPGYVGTVETTAPGAAALTEEEAAALAEANGVDWAAMTAEYGPYIAAAILADQALGGKLSNAVGDVVQGIGGAAEDVVSGAGNVISDIGGGLKDAASSFFGSFGFADGGQIKGYADGGISVGSRPDPNIDGISQANPDVSFRPTVGMFAAGGLSHLGGYSDGGRLLRGPGDGVSDSIPATIGGKQPARLADGEFVIPARIVSEIGNGSTEAGARKLYAMMDRVQAARSKTVGKGKVAKNTRADKYLPK